MYALPCLIRSSDGVELSAGTVIEFQLKIYIVKHIFISNDLQNIYIECTDPNLNHEEELMLEPNELDVLPLSSLSDVIKHRSKKVAQDNCTLLMHTLVYYPFHIRRVARKHLLLRKIRKTIRHFLKGHEVVRNFKIGLLDFDHDLKLLGMQHISKLSHRIEETSSVIDEILAPKWDMANLENVAFRIILNLDIKITSNFEINLIAQAGICHEEADMDDYRQQFLRNSLRKSASRELGIQNEEVVENFASTGEALNQSTLTLLDTPTIPGDHAKHLSESGSSRPQSRISGRSHSTVASSRGPRLQGFLQNSNHNDPKCPFPNSLLYSTVPEVITNDEDID